MFGGALLVRPGYIDDHAQIWFTTASARCNPPTNLGATVLVHGKTAGWWYDVALLETVKGNSVTVRVTRGRGDAPARSEVCGK